MATRRFITASFSASRPRGRSLTWRGRRIRLQVRRHRRSSHPLWEDGQATRSRDRTRRTHRRTMWRSRGFRSNRRNRGFRRNRRIYRLYRLYRLYRMGHMCRSGCRGRQKHRAGDKGRGGGARKSALYSKLCVCESRIEWFAALKAVP